MSKSTAKKLDFIEEKLAYWQERKRKEVLKAQQEERAQRTKKARILGMAILDLMTSGEAIHLKDEKALVNLMNQHLTKNSERKIFGLAPAKENQQTKKKEKYKSSKQRVPEDTLKTTTQEAVAPSLKTEKAKSLTQNNTQEDLIKEFEI